MLKSAVVEILVVPDTKPLKPESPPVVPRVRVLPVDAVPIVSVPVPVKVPLFVISALRSPPTVGLLPRGKVQSLLMVFSVPPV